MKNVLIDKLLDNEFIHSLLQKSENSYWLSALYAQDNIYNDDELASISRFAFLCTVSALNSDNDDNYADYAYKALKSICIEKSNEANIFNNIVGYDLTDKSVIYYFYLASLALKLNKTISARLDLNKFENSNENEADWGKRVLSDILQALILLIRKANGFNDIRKALAIIESLYAEQKVFESNYIDHFNYDEQTAEALALVGLYHTSKALTETANYLISGYKYANKRIDVVIRQHIELALKLQQPNSRLNDFITFIWNDLKILITNSIWNGTAFQDKIKRLCEKKSKANILELLPSQRKALSENLLDVAANATVLQMPTSAGKTLMAEFNIIVTKSLREDAKIVYVVPSRALVNQIFFDLRDDLGDLGFNIERTSSANEVDPTENDFLISDDINILVSTPEKLDLLIRRKHPSVEDVSLFIIDEAHTIENGERGAKLELLIALLRREKANSKFMLLSPFLAGDKDSLAKWLGGGNTIQIDWKPSEKIIVGLNVHKTQHHNDVTFEVLPSPYSAQSAPHIKEKIENPYKLISTTDKDKILEFSVKHFSAPGKTEIILCRGRRSANKQAHKIASWIESKTISDEVALVQKYMNEEIGEPTLFTELLSKGITVHHAGLSDESKLLIEHLIRHKQIQYVCATTTIAEGLNFPVSTVYFDSYYKGPKNKLSANDFWNIAGRAGRTMVDDFGKIILPYNSDNNKQLGQELIKKSSEQLSSVLSELFLNEVKIRQMINGESGIPSLLKLYPSSFGPLFQYFIHLLNVSQNEYVEDVEDLFKDSLEFYLLDTADKQERFINLCKCIYQSIEHTYSDKQGALIFADKTGFSVPSVLKIMYEKAQNKDISDLEGWRPEAIFNKHNPKNLTRKIEVIAALKETDLGTDDKNAPFNPELIAKMIIGWVKGDKLNTLSTIHPHYKKEDEPEERLTNFITHMNQIRFKASWGLSALEGIVRGKEDNMKDSYIPSLVYYGVEDKKALAMRMLGIPRSLSTSLSQIIEGDMNNYSFSKLRQQIKSLTNRDWDSFKPKESMLSGEEWKSIVNILMK